MIEFFTTRGTGGPPARNCTWNSTFAESCDGSFTTGRKTGARLRKRTGLNRFTRAGTSLLCLTGADRRAADCSWSGRSSSATPLIRRPVHIDGAKRRWIDRRSTPQG